jgi:peptidoglycan/LPS O-acetylase OafA/YrhL
MNIVRSVTSSNALIGMGHLWSLAQEEQFYLVWPALMVLACARWSPRRLSLSLAAAASAIAVYRVGLLSLGVSHERIYFAPDTHADPIIIGCLLAVAYPHLRKLRTWQGLLSAASIAAFSATMLPYSTLSLAVGTPAVSVCAAVMIVAALQEKNIVSRVLRFGPLVWIGTISYSLYLWQQLAHKLIPSATIAAAVSILIAWLSTRYVERPFRRVRHIEKPPLAATESAATSTA